MTDLPPTELLESSSIAKLMSALIDARAEFDPATRNASNPAFKSKYVDLEGVIDAVTPALLKHRVLLMQQPVIEPDGVVLFTRLIHESGEWIGSKYPVRPVQQTPQGEGSALTYARRYTAMAICGIAPEDDDGNAASSTRTYEPPAPVKSPADDARDDLIELCKANSWAPAQVAALFKDHKGHDLRVAGDPEVIRAFAAELPDLMGAAA